MLENIENIELQYLTLDDYKELNFQMSNDFHPTKVMKGYLEGDENSGEFAVLLEWDNIYYTKQSKT